MLRKRALRKILITTATVFILLVVYMIPNLSLNNEWSPNMEVEYVGEFDAGTVYLLDQNNLLVKANVLLKGNSTEEKIYSALSTLIINKGKNLPANFTGMLPEKTMVEKVELKDGIAVITFSNEFLKIREDLVEKALEAITYTLTSFEGISGVQLKVGENLVTSLQGKNVPEILTRDYGINKDYQLKNMDHISKVTIYYLTQEEDETYYVPVTKYVNDERDKIEIIIENLSSSYIYEPSLTSLLKSDVKLISYEVEEEFMTLNFNHNIFDSNNKVLEEVLYTISYSVFDTYDVSKVVFKGEDNTVIGEVEKKM